MKLPKRDIRLVSSAFVLTAFTLRTTVVSFGFVVELMTGILTLGRLTEPSVLSNVELRSNLLPDGGLDAAVSVLLGIFALGLEIDFFLSSVFFQSPAIRLVISRFAIAKLELLRDCGCDAKCCLVDDVDDTVDFMEALLLERCDTNGALGDL